MIESLNKLDAALLLFFNHLNNSFLDFIFYWISDKWIWIPFYIFLLWTIYKRDKKKLFIVFVFIAITITISDQVSSSLIKEYVMRLRPCNDPAIASQIHLVNGECGGKYGFISSHAANVFALATFLSILFSESNLGLQRALWIWAAVVSFSRIYLGVHYPGDVIGGVLIGMISGFVVARIYSTFIRKIRGGPDSYQY